jgi:hypothetical protein
MAESISGWLDLPLCKFRLEVQDWNVGSSWLGSAHTRCCCLPEFEKCWVAIAAWLDGSDNNYLVRLFHSTNNRPFPMYQFNLLARQHIINNFAYDLPCCMGTHTNQKDRTFDLPYPIPSRGKLDLIKTHQCRHQEGRRIFVRSLKRILECHSVCLHSGTLFTMNSAAWSRSYWTHGGEKLANL